ncbi:MAG TPA: MFS transporter [Solirubrobacterales bacterium]|jgi:EmrB/QacA subfamily drug resistance transporter|nr:MFS transporter [Solirubrobacterales bacterium]
MVLAIILGCYLMVVLDASVVLTALPDIRTDLGFSPASLSWVQNIYALAFGGLLLLGARAGDLLGRRQVFVVGLTIFTAASMLGGLAQSETWLLAARAIQGLGAAIAAPSTLALLTISFPEGSERTRAIALYSAVASAGASIGLVLGGLLTSAISWRWSLFINVPIGIVLVSLAPRYLPETERHTGEFDIAGAATSTLGMSALVYGLVRAAETSWGNTIALASFALAAVMLAAFVAIEKRARQPITPLRLFASRERVGAYATRLLMVGAMFGMFFYLTQFLQGAEGYSAFKAGLAFLPVSLTIFAMVKVVPRLLGRVGPFRVLIGGLTLALIGLLWLSRISTTTDYWLGIALPMLLVGGGMGLAFTPLTQAAIQGVDNHDAGAASGLVNVFQQLGSTLGIGLLVTVFAAASEGTGAKALIEGVPSTIAVSAGLIALALAVALTAMRPLAVSSPSPIPQAAAPVGDRGRR